MYPVLPAILEGTHQPVSTSCKKKLDPSLFWFCCLWEDGHVMYEKVLAEHQTQKQILKELEDLQMEGQDFHTRFNALREVDSSISPSIASLLTLCFASRRTSWRMSKRPKKAICWTPL